MVGAYASAAVLIALLQWFAPGISVTIRNIGKSPLVDLQVHVTGNIYRLGDLKSGGATNCMVYPKGESHVEISYRDAAGVTQRHSIDCYIEPGYRGVLEAEIEDGELIKASLELF
jgi:hypothetical protein